jgi:hypothetical protein
MLWRAIAAVLLMLISSQAHAVKSGGSGEGAGFACEGTTCICNGTYLDCKDMESSCKDKITCTSSYCSCTKKAAAHRAPLTKPQGLPKGSMQRY